MPLGLTLLFAGSALAIPVHYTAVLTGGAEFPANLSPGTGTADVWLDVTAHTREVKVDYTGLLAPVTAAHIHCCVDEFAIMPAASVATQTPTFEGFPATTSGTYHQTFDTTLATTWRAGFITLSSGTPLGAEAALAAGLALEDAYLNIHTTQYRGVRSEASCVQPRPRSPA